VAGHEIGNAGATEVAAALKNNTNCPELFLSSEFPPTLPFLGTTTDIRAVVWKVAAALIDKTVR